MTTHPSTRDLEELLPDIQAEYAQYGQRREQAIGHALECGRLLAIAREKAPHGFWGKYLSKLNIPTRTATEWIYLAEAGLTVEDILERGGIRAAREYLAAQRKSAKSAPGADLTTQMIPPADASTEETTAPEPDDPNDDTGIWEPDDADDRPWDEGRQAFDTPARFRDPPQMEDTNPLRAAHREELTPPRPLEDSPEWTPGACPCCGLIARAPVPHCDSISYAPALRGQKFCITHGAPIVREPGIDGIYHCVAE